MQDNARYGSQSSRENGTEVLAYIQGLLKEVGEVANRTGRTAIFLNVNDLYRQIDDLRSRHTPAWG